MRKKKNDEIGSLTTSHPTDNKKDNEDAKTRDALSQTFVCGVNVTYKLNPAVKLFAQPDFIFINNYGNHSGCKKVDFQFALGVNLNFNL